MPKHPTQQSDATAELVRTALALEPRDGHVCVFLPPLADGADYAALVCSHRGPRQQEWACPSASRATRRRSTRALNVIKVTPGPRRDRGQRASGQSRGEQRWRSPPRVYEEAAAIGLGAEKFMLDGRHTRHRRRQSHRARRHHAGRQPVPAAPRSAAAASSPTGRTTRRCPTCSPACSSARPARRRASTRRATSQLYELEIALAQMPRARRRRSRRGWSTGCSATCWSTSPATRIAPRSASTSSMLAGGPIGPPGPRRVPRLRDAAACAHEPRAAAADPRAGRPRFWERAVSPAAGALGHGAARPLHAAAFHVGRLRECHRRSAQTRAWRSSATGSSRTSSSASRVWARSSVRAWRWSCARRWSRGSCSASKAAPVARPAPVDSSLDRVQVLRHGHAPAIATLSTCNGYPLPLAPTGTTGRSRRGASAFAPGRPAKASTPPFPRMSRSRSIIVDTWNRRSIGRLPLSCHPPRRPQLPGPAGQCAGGGGTPAWRPTSSTWATRQAAPAPGPVAVHADFPLTLDLRRSQLGLALTGTRGSLACHTRHG